MQSIWSQWRRQYGNGDGEQVDDKEDEERVIIETRMTKVVDTSRSQYLPNKWLKQGKHIHKSNEPRPPKEQTELTVDRVKEMPSQVDRLLPYCKSKGARSNVCKSSEQQKTILYIILPNFKCVIWFQTKRKWKMTMHIHEHKYQSIMYARLKLGNFDANNWKICKIVFWCVHNK